MAVLVLLLALTSFLPSPAHATSWQWPLAGPVSVTRPFAPGPTPYSPGHRGVDLAGTAGQPVLAAGAGRVSYAGLLAGRPVVVVVHGILRTTYEPVEPSVRVGQPVDAAQQVGRLLPGHDGCPVAACLHWGLLRGETYLDPLHLIAAGPVRLLPVGGPVVAPPAAARGAPAGAVPAGAVPAGAVPAGAVPAGAVPAGAVPAPDAAAGPGPDPPSAERPPSERAGRHVPPALAVIAVLVGSAVGLARRRR